MDTAPAFETEPPGCWVTDQGSTTCTENTFFRMKHSRKMALIPEEEYARWNNAGKQELTPTETSEKPIQNDQGLKICAQSGSGERRLTQPNRSRKNNTNRAG